MAVEVSVREICGELELTALEPGSGTITFQTPEISRPGLQFTGFYEKFAPKRVQLIGNAEMYYLYSLPQEQLEDRMDRFMKLNIPCIVCARGNRPPDTLLEKARQHGVPVFITNRTTDRVGHEISSFIQKKLAPRILLHGELMDIYGTGVFIRGESGLGKSETALDLIHSGHRLIADDVVEISRLGERLVGTAPNAIKHIMDIRGIGIIDVRYLYGMSAILPEKDINLVIDLKELSEYMHMGEEKSDAMEILGIPVPLTLLPISPGRNVAVLVEVAVRNFRLKHMGFDTDGEFEPKRK